MISSSIILKQYNQHIYNILQLGSHVDDITSFQYTDEEYQHDLRVLQDRLLKQTYKNNHHNNNQHIVSTSSLETQTMTTTPSNNTSSYTHTQHSSHTSLHDAQEIIDDETQSYEILQ